MLLQGLGPVWPESPPTFRTLNKRLLPRESLWAQIKAQVPKLVLIATTNKQSASKKDLSESTEKPKGSRIDSSNNDGNRVLRDSYSNHGEVATSSNTQGKGNLKDDSATQSKDVTKGEEESIHRSDSSDLVFERLTDQFAFLKQMWIYLRKLKK